MLGCTGRGDEEQEDKDTAHPQMLMWQKRDLFSTPLPPPPPYKGRRGLDILNGLNSTSLRDLASAMLAASYEI